MPVGLLLTKQRLWEAGCSVPLVRRQASRARAGWSRSPRPAACVVPRRSSPRAWHCPFAPDDARDSAWPGSRARFRRRALPRAGSTRGSCGPAGQADPLRGGCCVPTPVHLHPMCRRIARPRTARACRAVQQGEHRGSDIRQIGPLMADAGIAGQGDGADRSAGRDQHLCEPAVCRRWAEEVSGAQHDAAYACFGRILEANFHRLADFALACHRVLRRIVWNQWEDVRPEVIDGPGQENGCTGRARGGDRILQHRQHERVPMAVARRVDGMNDDITPSAAARTSCTSIASPCRQSTSRLRAAACAALRDSARTRAPRTSSASITLLPMPPVAPSSSTWVVGPIRVMGTSPSRFNTKRMRAGRGKGNCA